MGVNEEANLWPDAAKKASRPKAKPKPKKKPAGKSKPRKA